MLACAREHNFQPNAMARGLVGSGTKLIGVVLTDISNSFFADLEKYMEQAARKKGYSLILFNSDYDREKEKHCLEVMRRYRVDGLIIVPVLEQDSEIPGGDQRTWISRLCPSPERRSRWTVSILTMRLQEPEWLNICGISAVRIICLWELPGIKKYLGFAEKMKETDPDFEQKLTLIETKNSREIQEHFESSFP